MKKISTIFLSFVAIFILLTPYVQASYIIDGRVEDWGVWLYNEPNSVNMPYLNNELPDSSPTIDYITEDNADINSGWTNVGPGSSQGNEYDVEAFYFDNDDDYGYFAIVTGLPNWKTEESGHVFFDLGKYQDPASPTANPTGYEFGIDIFEKKMYLNLAPEQLVNLAGHEAANPWRLGSNKYYIGDVEFAYSGEQHNHYVLEGKFNLDYLPLSMDPTQSIWAHWTMLCGNDELDLLGSINRTVIPEPSSLLLLSSGLLFGLKKRFKKA